MFSCSNDQKFPILKHLFLHSFRGNSKKVTLIPPSLTSFSSQPPTPPSPIIIANFPFTCSLLSFFNQIFVFFDRRIKYHLQPHSSFINPFLFTDSLLYVPQDPIPCSQSPITNHKSPIPPFVSPFVFQKRIPGHQLLIINHQLKILNFLPFILPSHSPFNNPQSACYNFPESRKTQTFEEKRV